MIDNAMSYQSDASRKRAGILSFFLSVPLRSMLSLDDRGGRPAVEAKPVPAGEAESAEREPDDPFDDRLSICLGVRRRDW